MHAVSHWGPTDIQEHLRIQAVESVWSEYHRLTWTHETPGRLYLEQLQQYCEVFTQQATSIFSGNVSESSFSYSGALQLNTDHSETWGNRSDTTKWIKMSKCSVWARSSSFIQSAPVSEDIHLAWTAVNIWHHTTQKVPRMASVNSRDTRFRNFDAYTYTIQWHTLWHVQGIPSSSFSICGSKMCHQIWEWAAYCEIVVAKTDWNWMEKLCCGVCSPDCQPVCRASLLYSDW